jgi:hypothetical protein
MVNWPLKNPQHSKNHVEPQILLFKSIVFEPVNPKFLLHSPTVSGGFSGHQPAESRLSTALGDPERFSTSGALPKTWLSWCELLNCRTASSKTM